MLDKENKGLVQVVFVPRRKAILTKTEKPFLLLYSRGTLDGCPEGLYSISRTANERSAGIDSCEL